MKKNCLICNDSFFLYPYQESTAKCCSNVCRLQWLHSRSVSQKTRLKMSKSHSGEKHWAWKGSQAPYRAIHQWINKRLRKPKRCFLCNKSFERQKIHWANKSKKYKRDLSDWISLCVKCHFYYDKQHLRKRDFRGRFL